MDIYKTLAIQALTIMRIQHEPTESLEILVQRIRTAVPLAASSTELEIRSLSQEIASAIADKSSQDFILQLLEKLEFEVSFLAWD